MNIQPKKPLKAAEVIQNPELIDQFSGPYAMIFDGSFLSGLGIPTHGRIVEALNVLDARGWQAVSIANDRGTMFALVKRKGL